MGFSAGWPVMCRWLATWLFPGRVGLLVGGFAEWLFLVSSLPCHASWVRMRNRHKAFVLLAGLLTGPELVVRCGHGAFRAMLATPTASGARRREWGEKERWRVRVFGWVVV